MSKELKRFTRNKHKMTQEHKARAVIAEGFVSRSVQSTYGKVPERVRLVDWQDFQPHNGAVSLAPGTREYYLVECALYDFSRPHIFKVYEGGKGWEKEVWKNSRDYEELGI